MKYSAVFISIKRDTVLLNAKDMRPSGYMSAAGVSAEIISLLCVS